jgi:site-specific recombinase XerD
VPQASADQDDVETGCYQGRCVGVAQRVKTHAREIQADTGSACVCGGQGKRGRRYGLRDATMILVAFRHGLRVSELCALTWGQIDFSHGLIHVRRMKNGIPSVHQLGGEEMRSLRALKREDGASRYVFMTERGAPMTAAGFRKMLSRLAVIAKFQFSVHPHMLRHACGFKLANDGRDTRALQHYLGHKNIMHTVRYTELSPDRFRNFWED